MVITIKEMNYFEVDVDEYVNEPTGAFTGGILKGDDLFNLSEADTAEIVRIADADFGYWDCVEVETQDSKITVHGRK